MRISAVMAPNSDSGHKPWFIHDQKWQVLRYAGEPPPSAEYLIDDRAGRHRDSKRAAEEHQGLEWESLSEVSDSSGAGTRDDVLLNTGRIRDLNEDPLDFRLLVVTAQSGMGKTCTSEWIQYRMMQERHLPSAAHAELCCRFRLADLAQAWQQHHGKDPLIRLVSCLQPLIRNACLHRNLPCVKEQLDSWLRHTIKSGQFCLILDGLDQLGLAELQIVEELLRWAQTAQGRFILCCGAATIHRAFREGLIFSKRPWTYVRLGEFDRHQQIRFLGWLEEDGSLRYSSIPQAARHLLTLPQVLELFRDAGQSNGTTASDVYSRTIEKLLGPAAQLSELKAILAIAAYECIVDFQGVGPDAVGPAAGSSRAEQIPPEYKCNIVSTAADSRTAEDAGEDVKQRIGSRFSRIFRESNFSDRWQQLATLNKQMNGSFFQGGGDHGVQQIVWSRITHSFFLAMYFAKYAEPGQEERLWDWVYLADQSATDEYYQFWQFLCEMPGRDRSSVVWLRSVSVLYRPSVVDSSWQDLRSSDEVQRNPGGGTRHAKRSNEMIYRSWPILQKLIRSERNDIARQAKSILDDWYAELRGLLNNDDGDDPRREICRRQLNDLISVRPELPFWLGTTEEHQIAREVKQKAWEKFQRYCRDSSALVRHFDRIYPRPQQQFIREIEESETIRAVCRRDFQEFCQACLQVGNSPRTKVERMPAFRVSKTSVSNAEYRVFDPSWGMSFRHGAAYVENSPTADHPAVGLSFYDCWVYTRWLAGGSGRSFRLLYEEEFEYLAKLGLSAEQWSWDTFFKHDISDLTADHAPHVPPGWRLNLNKDLRQLQKSSAFAAAPGSRRIDPAGTGIRGLQGNHWIWCEDRYRKLYEERVPLDSTPDGVQSRRSLRGGSWRNKQQTGASWHRAAGDPADQGRNYGMWLAEESLPVAAEATVGR